MLASTAFVGSVLLSTNLLRGRGSCSHINTNIEVSTGAPVTPIQERGMNTTQGQNKKRKQPMVSRETRAEGELEAAEAAFSSSLTALKALSEDNTSTISPVFIAAQKALKKAKSRIHALKRTKLVSSVAPLAWTEYPPPCSVPREHADPRFTQSFDVASLLPQETYLSESERREAETQIQRQRQEIQHFYEVYGFVVFSNVLSAEECAATEAEIWEYLEQKTEGLCRADPATHDLLSSKRYGLPDDQAIFTKQLVANRQSRRLYAALDCVTPVWEGCGPSVPETDAPGPNSVLVSNDRWCIYPPTHGSLKRQTLNPPVHLDLCPWTYSPHAQGGSRRGDPETDPDLLRYDGDTRIRQLKDWRAEINCVREEFGPHSQGVIALTDNEEEDGGTVVVPGFHKVFRDWQAALGTWEANRVGQRRRGCSYNFHCPQDPIHELSRRVPVRAGSLLLWNQCTVHGAVPNRSERFRVAQFVRGVRAGEVGVRESGEGGGLEGSSSDSGSSGTSSASTCCRSARAVARARAVLRELRAAGAELDKDKDKKKGEGPELLALAPHVFGVTPQDIQDMQRQGMGDIHHSTHTSDNSSNSSNSGSAANHQPRSEEGRGGGLVEKHWNI